MQFAYNTALSSTRSKNLLTILGLVNDGFDKVLIYCTDKTPEDNEIDVIIQYIHSVNAFLSEDT